MTIVVILINFTISSLSGGGWIIIHPVGMEETKTRESEKVAFNNMPGHLPVHNGVRIDHAKCRYPHCIVWTPIPCLT